MAVVLVVYLHRYTYLVLWSSCTSQSKYLSLYKESTYLITKILNVCVCLGGVGDAKLCNDAVYVSIT